MDSRQVPVLCSFGILVERELTRKDVTFENSVPMNPKTMSANFLDFSHSRGSASTTPATAESFTYSAQDDS